MTLKQDFTIFKNNSDLIFLDSTSTSQKPQYVIDGIKDYLENNYSNIHRGLYDIAINSEKMYFDSKKIVAKYINAYDFREVIYTSNSNYALNLLTQTLRLNSILKAGDKVLLSIVEHHSNIVPWLILKEEIGIEIDFVKIDDNYGIDIIDFDKKYDQKVKIVSLTQVSNVTGEIFDLKSISKKLKQETLFIVDASQSVPHFKIDVQDLEADFVFFTGHKVFADSGIGVLWGKYELLEKLKPIFSGGGAINEVKETCFKYGALPFKFEPGTPNVTGAVSLLKAFEYIESIGGYEKMQEIEDELVKYTINEFSKRPFLELVGSKNPENRVGVFSFYIKGVHSIDIADVMAENNICIRAGMHCTEPFMDYLGLKNTARMSLYIYNTTDDIDNFFSVIDKNFN